MGLDVGVVKITYLERPREPVYGALWRLAGACDPEEWGGGWDGNAFVETTRRRMLAKARIYAKQQALTQDERDNIMNWIRALPWNGDTIMLHLGW